MKILLVNPPNCGRSIPEEEYGITSLKMIFRGEPLALEVLAGNLDDHEVEIIDLKVEPDGLTDHLAGDKAVDLVGFTAVTCEANTVLRLAQTIKKRWKSNAPVIVVGGHHASSDPEFFNTEAIDYVIAGLGKLSFRLLVDQLATGKQDIAIAGVARTRPGKKLDFGRKRYSFTDLVDHKAPRYDLVERYRDNYVMSGVGGKVGFVATAFGCTHCCSFCSIPVMTGGRYLSHSVDAIIRDMELLAGIPLIRFVDANTFGDVETAAMLAQKIIGHDRGVRIVADVRADTVVRNPGLMRLWHRAGLVAVVIGFEEIDDLRLAKMNKHSSTESNIEALEILAEIGIRVIGDFIISPDYSRDDFAALTRFIAQSSIALPIPSILTPIPGTPLYRDCHKKLEITDLDYYTFSNAVLPTTLPKEEFYTLYAELMKHLHQHITTS
jgi:hopanoid C-3 methylase